MLSPSTSADVSVFCAALPEEDQGRGRGIEHWSLRERSESETALKESGGGVRREDRGWGDLQARPHRAEKGVLRAGCRPLCCGGCVNEFISWGVTESILPTQLVGGVDRILEPLGLRGVIRKEAWPFCRTISVVRLCWELEEPKGPKGHTLHRVSDPLLAILDDRVV